MPLKQKPGRMRFVPVLLMLCLLFLLLAECNQTGPSVTEPYVLTIMSALNPDNPGEESPPSKWLN